MTTSLPSIKVHSNNGRSADVVEMFSRQVEPIFSLNIDNNRGEAAHVGLECYNAGELLFGRSSMIGPDFHYYRDLRKVARTGLDLILVQIITQGSDLRTHDDGEFVTQPGDVCIADLSRPFATRTRNCGNYSFVVPRRTFSNQEPLLSALHGLVLHKGSMESELLRSHLDTVWSLAREMTTADMEGLAAGTARLFAALVEARCRRLADGRVIETAMLLRIKRHIEAHLRAPDLTPSSIAKTLGLSRSSLFKIAEPLGGVANYIRRRRLRRVFIALSDPTAMHRSISEIALDWGFLELSTFFRAFRAEFGMSPGDVRGADATAVALMRPADDDGLDASLTRWLSAI